MFQGFRLHQQQPTEAGALANALGVSPGMGQLLINRGWCSADSAKGYLRPRLQELAGPEGMADLDVAVNRLARAVEHAEKVVVFGDYDVDGITSSVLLAEVLEALGARVVVQNASRFHGGYGLSQAAAEGVRETGATLLVTCDCGSSDHDRIAFLQAHGIETVVIDHHQVPSQPLPAVAFLNPHRPDCRYAYKGLASVGLAFIVAARLRRAKGSSIDLREWLDLVALGTIADVAPLDGENRRLVRAGLARLTLSSKRPGLRAMLMAARVSAQTTCSSTDVAFRLAPRLNAPGRLGEAKLASELLRCKSLEQGLVLAQEVEALNQKRQELERRVTEEARTALDEHGDISAAGVVVASTEWHRGVIGISASRLVDLLRKPVAVIAIDAATQVGVGSCRAPESHSVYEALQCARRYLLGFGGHARAAGFTITQNAIPAFRAAFADALEKQVGKQPAVHKAVDLMLAVPGDVMPSHEELALLEPLGHDNPHPTVYCACSRLLESRVVGAGHLRACVEVGTRRFWGFGPNMGKLTAELGTHTSFIAELERNGTGSGASVGLKFVKLERA